MSFEQDFNRLQEIAKQLEEGDLPLEFHWNYLKRELVFFAAVKRN